MNWGEILKMVIPILVVSIGWLLGQVSSFSNRLISLESKMPALITSEGVPTDSPLSAEKRGKMREELQKEINDLNVRLRLLEEREKR
ncbi:hypothetical protein EBZ39_08980 [bacterium]|nr:hypothetical protein [bacterium]